MSRGNLDREVEGRLSNLDVRYTRTRQAVVSTLAGAEGPLSAAELHAAANGVLPLSSVYRSLAVLEEAGVLAPHHGTKA